VKINKFNLLKNIFLISLLFQFSLEANEKLVLIGGLDEARVNKCSDSNPCEDKGYLKLNSKLGDALLELETIDSNIKNYEFKWSGDPVPHGEGDNLKKKFEDWFYTNVCGREEACEVSFIAHSWGTIIGSDFIASISENTKIKIKTVITYGSPVTGAQINDKIFSKTVNFWEDAVKKVKDMDGKWINIINTKDIVAWKIPNTINLQPTGYISTKGRLPETFPVNASEFDLKYLGTTIARLGGMVATDSIGIYVGYIFGSSEVDSSFSIYDHFTESYESNRLIKYLLINDGFASKYFDNDFGVSNLGLPISKEIRMEGEPTCQNFENGILLWDKDTGVREHIGVNCDSYKYTCFTDVNTDETYNYDICKIKRKKIVNGYTDGSYRGNQPISRAEFLKVVLLAKYPQEIIDKDTAPNVYFTDIEGDSIWIQKYINFANKKLVEIKGYPNGDYQDFRPNQPITLAEASKIIFKTLISIEGETYSSNNGEWYSIYKDAIENIAGVEKKNENDYADNKLMSRGYMAHLISKIQKF